MSFKTENGIPRPHGWDCSRVKSSVRYFLKASFGVTTPLNTKCLHVIGMGLFRACSADAQWARASEREAKEGGCKASASHIGQMSIDIIEILCLLLWDVVRQPYGNMQILASKKTCAQAMAHADSARGGGGGNEKKRNKKKK